MENKEILKEAAKISKELAEAIENDFISKGQKVPQIVIEFIKIVSNLKKK